MLVRLRFGLQVEPWGHTVERGIRADLGGVEEELLTPHQPRLLAQFNDVLEEALEDGEPQPLPDTRQAGMVRQWLLQSITEVPAMGEMQAGGLDQAAARPDPLE